jgi:hypothetical protein
VQIHSHLLIRVFLVAALLLSGMYFRTCVPDATADDHDYKGKHSGRRILSNSEHGRGDKGNEVTGQSAAWILAAANLPALLSLLARALIRHTSLAGSIKERIKRFNQTQKRYLMPFHYLLNPLALLLALIHFSLSHCRSSSLPEWGLAVMAALAVIGILIKFKFAPKNIRSTIYRIHTNPLPVGLLVTILLIGHSIVD